MKKVFLISTILLLVLTATYAQQGEIIYTDYEPDSIVQLQDFELNPESKFDIDMDLDGTPDFYVYFIFYSASFHRNIQAYNPEEWEIKAYHYDDTLTPLTEEENGWFGGIFWHEAYIHIGGSIVLDLDRFAVRHKVGDDYYFGWFRAYPELQQGYRICLDKMAWCTVPNYPLVWGQTTLITEVEETESNAFATIHPNPTTGLVTVAGENLQQAEVVNMLGQVVSTCQGNGNTIVLDISTLPTGVYFVNVTDADGRKCTRKVVRE